MNKFQLLTAIFQAPIEIGYFLTAAEGEQLLAEGLITVDPSQVSPSNPNAYRVTLTEAGLAQLTTIPTEPTPTPKVVPVISQVTSAIGLPQPKSRSGRSGGTGSPKKGVYPFDELLPPVQDPVTGQWQYYSFHVAAGPDNPQPWKKLASTTTAANKRYMTQQLDPATGQPVMQTVAKKVPAIDPVTNAPVLNADGSKQLVEQFVSEPVMVPTRKFASYRVDATDPNGVGARLYRIA